MNETGNLKNLGLKATLPRLKILSLFENSTQRHMSAEDVYKVLLNSGDDIGLATVYRVLTQFEQAGLLIRHHFESGKAVFELNQGNHHDHLVCLQCGASLKSAVLRLKNILCICMPIVIKTTARIKNSPNKPNPLEQLI
jgi:Fe2+ or Zn2+ uptake regulation protein